MGTLDAKLEYLAETKTKIRHAIEYGTDGTYVSDQAKMKIYSFRFFNR